MNIKEIKAEMKQMEDRSRPYRIKLNKIAAGLKKLKKDEKDGKAIDGELLHRINMMQSEIKEYYGEQE